MTKENGHQIIHMKSDLRCFITAYRLSMVLNLAQQGLKKSLKKS